MALRAKGAMVGAEQLKVDRDVLIGWLERVVKELNEAENKKVTGGLYDCFTKVGQNLFAHNEAAFTTYLDRLSETSVYEALDRANASLTQALSEPPPCCCARGC